MNFICITGQHRLKILPCSMRLYGYAIFRPLVGDKLKAFTPKMTSISFSLLINDLELTKGFKGLSEIYKRSI